MSNGKFDFKLSSAFSFPKRDNDAVLHTFGKEINNKIQIKRDSLTLKEVLRKSAYENNIYSAYFW